MGKQTRKLVAFFVASVLLTACGQGKRVETLQGDNPNLLTIDHTVSIVPDHSTSKIEAFQPYVCTVTVQANIVKNDSGYALTLSWKFEGTEPQFWELSSYADQNNGQEEATQDVATAFVRSGERRELVSVTLERNRRYKFVLIGRVSQNVSGKFISGNVIYKTIHANLVGLP